MRWDLTELRRAAVAGMLVTVIGASWSAASAADRAASPVVVARSYAVIEVPARPLAIADDSGLACGGPPSCVAYYGVIYNPKYFKAGPN